MRGTNQKDRIGRGVGRFGWLWSKPVRGFSVIGNWSENLKPRKMLSSSPSFVFFCIYIFFAVLLVKGSIMWTLFTFFYMSVRIFPSFIWEVDGWLACFQLEKYISSIFFFIKKKKKKIAGITYKRHEGIYIYIYSMVDSLSLLLVTIVLWKPGQ